jgi:hypothetical protein
MEKIAEKQSQFKGWDKDEPATSVKKLTGDDDNRLDYEKPVQQETDIEILQSIERPSLTSVFGTSVPPSGLSGMLRRFAYRFSESSFGHWIPLLLADRINVVEGIIDDLRSGHIPNIIKERGWSAEWKYNRKELITKVAAGIVITAAMIFLLTRKQRNVQRNKD